VRSIVTEVLIAVAEGPYVFEADAVVAVLAEQWPQTSWAPTEPGDPDPSLGQFTVVSASDPPTVLLADLLPAGQGIGAEASFDLLADFLAQLTRLPGFPDDGSVIVTDWALEMYPLRPRMEVGEIREADVG
jgi:hypothetical protein